MINRKIFGKSRYSDTSHTLLNSLCISEGMRGKLEYIFELNENENIAYKNWGGYS